jgi:hypothetical protein
MADREKDDPRARFIHRRTIGFAGSTLRCVFHKPEGVPLRECAVQMGEAMPANEFC